MDVFVLPVGQDAYELYCESVSETEADDEEASPGFLGRLRQRFSETLRAAEEEEKHERPAKRTWLGRFRDRGLGWLVARIAEQRLFWNLRRHTAAQLVYPTGLTADDAMALLQRTLRQGYDWHRRWLIVDAVGFLLSIPFTVIPGPNVIQYYFVFRLVGHWLSMRGAQQGLSHITWTTQSSPVLGELREVASLGAPDRRVRVEALATRLGLPRLPRFFERTMARRHRSHPSRGPAAESR